MKNDNQILKLQRSSISIFCKIRKWNLKNFYKSFFTIFVIPGCIFISSLKISAQENFTGCDKPEARKDLPFSIDRVKQMCKKDLDNKKEGWYPTGLPLINSDPNEGIGYGVRVYGYNNGKKMIRFLNILRIDFVFLHNILIRQKMLNTTNSVWTCPM
ncbi:hypothetical protein LEP1GSC083_1226 [Leptospira interrogans serovar Pyrogenes str. L0374]|uniref:DUF5982 domain-containing protein n=3 Tax=Leptospira interrogans TaxID=173 RepID=M6KKN6_LEPIR|nr:hypothetical protein LEP1GSC148_4605 [Leptospira interrogans serovar Canicola str. LT1962]EMM81643.1 hypothetical protein LEP1GSC037_1269 [Leptospira interrogans str. 2006001854]EMN28347.1 hypothetical protein LEP1GSC083_1226 [Leptospira interrogans serovar Pyrogenes str. L0374]